MFRTLRDSTGKNFDDTYNEYVKAAKNDLKYKELSIKAHNAEVDRIMAEKRIIDAHPEMSEGEVWDEIINADNAKEAKDYWKIYDKSIEATKAKDRRSEQIARSFADAIKTAKIKDIGVKDSPLTRKYISGYIANHYYDDNLNYEPDFYYERGMKIPKYK